MRIIIAESLSKGKKQKGPRSVLLSELMKGLTEPLGSEIGQAIIDGDAEAFKSKMDEVVSGIATKIEQQGKK